MVTTLKDRLIVNFETSDTLLDIPDAVWDSCDCDILLQSLRKAWFERGFCPAVDIRANDRDRLPQGFVLDRTEPNQFTFTHPLWS